MVQDGGRMELRQLVTTLADMIWDRERRLHRPNDAAILGYVQDAVAAELAYRRNMRELDRRIVDLVETVVPIADRGEPVPASNREPLGRKDWLKAVGIGVTAGLILRTAFEMTASQAGFLFLGAAAAGQDAHAASLVRLWMLGGVLITLGTGALTALVVRAHQTLWVLVSMACAVIPLLTP